LGPISDRSTPPHIPSNERAFQHQLLNEG
jgi:hypothetical protein